MKELEKEKAMRYPWGITERQAEILNLITSLEVDCNKDIGRRLGIEKATVDGHIALAIRRMKVKSKTQVALVWDRWKRTAQ